MSAGVVAARHEAGLRECRRNRQLGITVSLYDGVPAGMDVSAGRWQTVCDRHNTIISHRTISLARSHLACPLDWCEECRSGNQLSLDCHDALLDHDWADAWDSLPEAPPLVLRRILNTKATALRLGLSVRRVQQLRGRIGDVGEGRNAAYPEDAVERFALISRKPGRRPIAR